MSKHLFTKREVAAICGIKENMISLKFFVGIEHDANGIKTKTNRSLFLQKLQVHLTFSDETLNNPVNVKGAISGALLHAMNEMQKKYEVEMAARANKNPGSEPLPNPSQA
jgi:hypothetical protein